MNLEEDFMILLNNPDDDKDGYYSWSILLAHDYFVDIGSTNMIGRSCRNT